MIDAEVRTRWVPVPGGRLGYDETGSGDPVVLLHAGIGDRRGWDLVVPLLARDHRVIRYDARGFGRSTPPNGPFAFERDLAAVLDHLELPSAALVGNSFGAATAVDFALGSPGRVDALVLVAPSLTGVDLDDAGHDARVAAAVRSHGADTAAVRSHGADTAAVRSHGADTAAALDRRHWAPLRSAPEVEALLDTMVADNTAVYTLPDGLVVTAPDPTARLAEIDVPTLVVLGAQDRPGITRIGRLLAATVPGAALETVPGADHLLPLRAPHQLCDLLHDHRTLEGTRR